MDYNATIVPSLSVQKSIITALPTTLATLTLTTLTTHEPQNTNVWKIVGIAAGAIAVIVCCIVILCCVIRKRRLRSQRETKGDRCKKEDEAVMISLIDELNHRNSYIKPTTNETLHKDSETGYVLLSENPEKTHLSTYSDPPPPLIKKPIKPKPLPKPRQLKPPPQSENNNSNDDVIASLRKPMPAPRPTILTTNNMALRSSQEPRESENDFYSAPDLLEGENEIYSEPDANEGGIVTAPSFETGAFLNNSVPCTSAQKFERSNENIDIQDFALYVPVGEQDMIYKVPSNQQKHDPPSNAPTAVNEDIYTDMNGDDIYEDVTTVHPEYEDISNVIDDVDDDYETMTSTQQNDVYSETYESMNQRDLSDSDNDYVV